MPEGDIFIERRQHKRIDFRIKVKYKIVTADADRIKKEAREADSINVSVGGIQLIAEEEFSATQVLRLEFGLQGHEKPIITFAEIKWCTKGDDSTHYKAGLEFLVLKDEDEDILREIAGE